MSYDRGQALAVPSSQWAVKETFNRCVSGGTYASTASKARRLLLLLVLWGPGVTIIIDLAGPGAAFVQMEGADVLDRKVNIRDGYLSGRSAASVKQLLDPARLVIGGLAIIFLLNAFVRKRFVPFDRTEMLMLAFSVTIVASVLINSAVMGYSMRVASDAFIIPFLGYFTARRLITDDTQLARLVDAIIRMSASLIILSLIDRVLNDSSSYRITGPFSSKSALYVPLLIAFLLAATESSYRVFIWRKRSVVSPTARGFVLYLVPVIVLLTWSRGIWLGLFSALWMILLLGRKLLDRRKQYALIAFCSFLLVALIGFGIQGFAEKIESRIANTDTVYGRIATWTLALKAGLNSPVLGNGMDSMRVILAREGAEYAGKHSFPRVHNSFLQLFAEQGVLGLCLYMAVVVSILRFGLRIRARGIHATERWRGILIVAILAGYLMPALFASTLHLPVQFTHLLVYVVIGAIAGRYSSSMTTSTARS